jgi:hypothetical protein
VGWTPPRESQCEEEPEQAHRRSDAHEHLAKVGKDCHQGDGKRRLVVELETLVLQQCEEEGGHRERKPGQRVGVEEDNLAAPQIGERNGSAPHLPIILRRV